MVELKFTESERKEIFDDWRKHIRNIPTQEALQKRYIRKIKPPMTRRIIEKYQALQQ